MMPYTALSVDITRSEYVLMADTIIGRDRATKITGSGETGEVYAPKRTISQNGVPVAFIPRRSSALYALIVITALACAACGNRRQMSVLRQTTAPPLATNCYLLYDGFSGEAALVDVGGPLDSLVTFIDEHALNLKYIFITHCHQDHTVGVPDLMQRFPDAKLCVSKADYDDARLYAQWASKLGPDEVARIRTLPEAVRLMDFDLSGVSSPDIYVENNQRFPVGDMEIKAILSPGHSRGSICYAVGNVLFSGDVLFYRKVGRTDLEGMSWDSLVLSVRHLYDLLADETIVYPGHGQPTSIGSEKRFNEKISALELNRPEPRPRPVD